MLVDVVAVVVAAVADVIESLVAFVLVERSSCDVDLATSLVLAEPVSLAMYSRWPVPDGDRPNNRTVRPDP